MLKRGSSGAGVEDLQRKLLANGVNPGPVDGLFGPKTEDAVRRFQERHDLQVDGIAGPKTMKAIEDAKAASEGAATQTSAATAGAKTASGKSSVTAGKQTDEAREEKAAAAKAESEKETTAKVGGVFSRIFKKD